MSSFFTRFIGYATGATGLSNRANEASKDGYTPAEMRDLLKEFGDLNVFGLLQAREFLGEEQPSLLKVLERYSGSDSATLEARSRSAFEDLKANKMSALDEFVGRTR